MTIIQSKKIKDEKTVHRNHKSPTSILKDAISH